MKRVLGLDVGSKTIGVAVTDELGMAAHGVTVVARKGTKPDVLRILELVKKYDAGLVIVGMPYELDGAEGQRAKRVRVFADALSAAGANIELWDERFSTKEAEESLLEGNVSREKRRELIDKVAAQFILQSWLHEHPQTSG